MPGPDFLSSGRKPR